MRRWPVTKPGGEPPPAACAQWAGLREDQEDACGWLDLRGEGKGLLAVLSDGMGGMERGGEAARRAVEEVLDFFRAAPPGLPRPALLEGAADRADEALAAAAPEGGWGATLAAALLADGALYWAAAGDSRVYLLREGVLYQVSEDHSLATLLLHRALKDRDACPPRGTEEELGKLTSYLGGGSLVELDLSRRGFPLEAGDKVLLLSDGVYRALTREELEPLAALRPEAAVEAILEAVQAKRLAGQDNCTAVAVEYDGKKGSW